MKISEFQEYLKDRLNAVEALVDGGCKALAEDSLSIMNDVQVQLNTARGVCIVVTTPEFKRNGCAADGIPVEATIAVKCIEIPATNRAKSGHLTALDVAEIVAHSLADSNIQFSDIRQTVDRQSGTVTASVNFNVCIKLTLS